MIILYLLICLICAGFFAGLETGLLAVNRMVIQMKSRKGVLYARSVEFLLDKPERLLGTTLIGHNIANVTAAVIVTNHFENLGLASYTWVAIIGMTLVFLVFDDFIPKSFLRQHANTIAARLAPVVLFFYWIFLPAYLILNTVVRLLLLLTGTHRPKRAELRTKRDLRFLVSLTGKEAGVPVVDQKIIEDILHFRDQIAREAMIPFHKLPVLNIKQEIMDAVRISVDSGQRFIPVSEHRTDNMVGYIDTTELLWSKAGSVLEIMKPAQFFPDTRRIPDLLLDMNQRNQKVVFLVDEYGGIAGMITPGQIVADVVHYTPEVGSFEEDIKKTVDGAFLVHGDMDLDDFCRELGITLGASMSSTVGGFLGERMGVIPEQGAHFEEAGYRFTVKQREDRHIDLIEVRATRKSDA